jgi:hypothetical protein
MTVSSIFIAQQARTHHLHGVTPACEEYMPLYRVTIRFGAPRQQYHVEDLTANSLREAVRMAAEQFPDAASSTADLVEIRLQLDPDEREQATA